MEGLAAGISGSVAATDDTVGEIIDYTPWVRAAPTAIAAFAGMLPQGPAGVPTLLSSPADFASTFGVSSLRSALGDAVSGFFANGGATLYVLRLPEPDIVGDLEAKTGLYAFENAADIGIFAAPLESASETASGLTSRRRAFNSALIRYAASRRAMAILDPPSVWSQRAVRRRPSALSPARALADLDPGANEFANAAVYFGRCTTSPDQTYRTPTGAIAGLWAKTDANAGVWKAPAGSSAVLAGVSELETALDAEGAATLDASGINTLRSFATAGGPVVFGARTLAAQQEWRYLSVRRLALYLESSIATGIRYIPRAPNAPLLLTSLRDGIEAFMQQLFAQGAFAGTTAQQAYFVKCDAADNSIAKLSEGVVDISIGFAPLVPAEFNIVQIGHISPKRIDIGGGT